jgi:hypothetical protein
MIATRELLTSENPTRLPASRFGFVRVFVTFKDELLAGERFVYDMAGLLDQLT